MLNKNKIIKLVITYKIVSLNQWVKSVNKMTYFAFIAFSKNL